MDESYKKNVNYVNTDQSLVLEISKYKLYLQGFSTLDFNDN